jgi:septin family protein
MQDLKDATSDVLYENYRAVHLAKLNQQQEYVLIYNIFHAFFTLITPIFESRADPNMTTDRLLQIKQEEVITIAITITIISFLGSKCVQ